MEIVAGEVENIPNIRFKERLMRWHLAQCLFDGKMELFPTYDDR